VAGLTGILSADFTSFLNAVQKAEASLKGFETGSGKVETALTKMANSFSGQKIIQDATLMTKAINDAGGASTLTAKELARVNATLNEAIDKYTALGQKAPAAMQKLAEETSKHPSLLEKITGALGPMGAAMAGAFTVGAVIGAGKQVIDFASHVTDLSAKLGISTSGIQKFEMAFAPAGISIDTVAAASLKLSKNLIGDDKSTVNALMKMGLSVKELKALSPEDQFLEVADAVGRIQSPTEKAYAAMTVFGKGGGELLAGLTGDLKKTTEGFEAMGLIIDEETIKAADDLGDQLGLMGKQLLAIVATVIGPLLPAISALGKVLMWVGANVIGPVLTVSIKVLMTALEGLWIGIATLLSKLADMAQRIPLVGSRLTGLAAASDWLAKSAKDTSAHVVGLWTSTEKVGEVAKTATPHLLGLGGASEVAEKAAKDAAEAAKKFAEELDKHTEAAKKNEAGLFGLNATVGVLITSEIEAVKAALAAYEAFKKLEAKIADIEKVAWIANFGFQGMADGLEHLGKKSTELDDVKKHLDDVKAHTNDWGGALSDLTNDFVQMAQIGGKGFNDVARDVGMSVKAFEALNRAATAMTSSTTGGFNAANLTALAAGYVGVAIAAYQITASLVKARDAAAQLRETARFKALFQDEWGTAIQFSDQLVESLKNGSASLVDIIKELGGWAGLTQQQLEHVTMSLRDLLGAAASGGPLADRSLTELDKTLVDMGHSALKTSGLMSKLFVDMTKAAKDSGVELEGVNDIILNQLGAAAEGLNELLTGLNKGLGDSFTITKEQGAGLAAATAATFAEMIDRGMSYKQALDALQPSIDILTETLKKSGVDGGAAFAFLTEMSRIAGDEFMGPLSDAITGANKALKGLHNSGILNQSMFSGLEQSAMQAYQKIIDGGGDGNAALMMMQPTLQTLWSLQKDFGYTVDAATQKLLDEAEATGKVGDKHRPIAEQMLLSTQAIEKAVGRLVDGLLGLTPAAESGAKGITDAFSTIKAPKIEAPWKDWGPPPGASGPMADFAASGGVVTDRGIQHFGLGGTVLRFQPRGSDTVPAMLSPGEMVLTPAQQKRLLNGGGGDALHAEVRGLRSDMQGLRRDLPRAVALASSSATLRKRRAS
jgi:hypothetical protein